MQAVKGGAEVVVTGGLIYGLTSWSRLQVETRETKLRDYRDELQILHRVFRHDLRNKLNVIKGNAELLTEDLEDEDLVRKCDAISESAAAIMEYSDSAANIRMLSTRDEAVAIDLAETLTEIVDRHDWWTRMWG
jgi:signal transduction histidine kinase